MGERGRCDVRPAARRLSAVVLAGGLAAVLVATVLVATVLAATALAATALAATPAVPTRPAAAASSDAPASAGPTRRAPGRPAVSRVVLQAVGPDLLRPGGRLVVSGTVEPGDTGDALTAVRLAVGDRVTDLAALAPDAAPRLPRRLEPVPLAPAPGGDLRAPRPFTVRAEVDDLGLRAGGVYPVAVDALVGDVVFARTATWVVASPADLPVVDVTVAVPLSTRPLLDATGEPLPDAPEVLAAQTGPGGRLREVVEAVRGATAAAADDDDRTAAGVALGVDPDLLVSASVVAERLDPASAAELAAFRGLLAEAAGGTTVAALPVADADVSALLAAGTTEPARDAVQEGARLVGEGLAVPVATWPAPGPLPRDAVARLGAPALMTGAAVPGPAVAVDDRLGSLVEQPRDGAGDAGLLARRRVGAALALRGGAGGRGGGPAAPVVLPLPRTPAGTGTDGPGGTDVAALLRVLDRLPWVRLSDLPAPREGVRGPSPRATAGAGPRPLGRDALRQVAALREVVDRWETLAAAPLEPPALAPLPGTAPASPPAPTGATPGADGGGGGQAGAQGGEDTAPAGPPPPPPALPAPPPPGTTTSAQAQAQLAVARGASAAWRGAGASAGRDWRDAALATLEGAVAGVRLQPAPDATLTGAAGELPVVVTNDLPFPAEVVVRLGDAGTGRLRTGADAALVVPADGAGSVLLPVRAATAGRFPVQVQLLDVAGRPLGGPQAVTVRVTAVGRLALAITLAAAAVLFLGVGVRLVRRARAVRDAGTPEPSA